MKKTLSMLLCVCLVLPLLLRSAYAVETYITSPEGVRMIASFEGFRSMPYADDRGNWYVGYGTMCDPEDYPYGVTEEEAYDILLDALSSKEDRVNSMLLRNGISVTQEQFDALVSMTYTLGQQWMGPSCRLYNYLTDGAERYTEDEIVNAFATWCHVGSEPLTHLADRRLTEAFLFLYGEYENDGPECYRFVHYDPNGGEMENKTVFYPVGEQYGDLAEVDGRGRQLDGWYTADGIRLTGRETVRENIYVTARWMDGQTIPEEKPPEKPKQDFTKWVNPYSDVVESDWFYKDVRELSANGVVNGNPDGTFRPQDPLKAGEALKLLLLAAGYTEQSPVNGHWASGYLSLAESLGCVYPNEIWDLDGEIPRLTIARIVSVALGIPAKWGASPYVDVDDPYALALYEQGIMRGETAGRDRFLRPNSGIRRSEICAIACRMLRWDKASLNDPDRSGFIYYREKYVPVMREVPVCSYDKNLFVSDGSTMHYNGGGYAPAIGIDVSRHQGEIDWPAVASSGVEFAFIRLGGRGYESGEIFLDQNFRYNFTEAKRAGIKVGVYFFSQAISTEEAMEEIRFVLENLEGEELDYPLVYDWERAQKGGRAYDLDMATLTDCAITFCEEAAWAGYTPMVYCGLDAGYNRYDLSRLTRYDLWFPQYGTDRPAMYYDYRIWQYSDSGSVPGIKGRVDMNIAMRPY